ncbi:hypothetical protein SS50377_22934 [Spironucleus salmonicida]|uniref:Uncharacterized protein n=1 Tax=Spironucleus salmonicida TaxID=348837 RepID=V6M6N5_9EUKA|nr:hypothetical protein SS50377_22934 [Spironucleus salmonicida]|eukprot:EST49079.1 Hypothetical protein SS50377_10657 [Spironucleus salmonicida]
MLRPYSKISRQQEFREIKSSRFPQRTKYAPQPVSPVRPKTPGQLFGPLTKFLSETDLFLGRCEQERIYLINKVQRRETLIYNEECIVQAETDQVIKKQAEIVLNIELQPPEINANNERQIFCLLQQFQSIMNNVKKENEILTSYVYSRQIFQLISSELKENITIMQNRKTLINTCLPLDLSENDGYSCIFRQVNQVFMTQHQDFQFESLQIDGYEHLMNKTLLEAIKSLRRTLILPIVNLCPSHVKQEYMRLNQKFTDDNNIQSIQEELLNKQLDSQVVQFEEEQFINELLTVYKVKEEQKQKIKNIDLDEDKKLQLLLDCQYYTLETSISRLASQVGCPGPTGNEEVTTKLIRKIDDKISQIIEEYFQCNKNDMRKSRIKWMAQYEKKLSNEKRKFSRNLDSEKIPAKYRKNMDRSFSPKRQTLLFQSNIQEARLKILQGDKNTFFDM